jgi:hypothetical protein
MQTPADQELPPAITAVEKKLCGNLPTSGLLRISTTSTDAHSCVGPAKLMHLEVNLIRLIGSKASAR